MQRRDGPRRLRDSDDGNDDDDDDMVSILQQLVKRFHPLQNAYRDKAISLTVPVDFLSDSAPFTPVLPPGWSLRVYAFSCRVFLAVRTNMQSSIKPEVNSVSQQRAARGVPNCLASWYTCVGVNVFHSVTLRFDLGHRS